jgi:hypothetical protein
MNGARKHFKVNEMKRGWIKHKNMVVRVVKKWYDDAECRGQLTFMTWELRPEGL